MSSEELLDNSGTILEDEFTLRSESYRVGLTKNSIRLSSDSYVRLIPLEDVIGSTVEVSYQSDDQSAFLLLDTCQRIPSEKNRRQSSIRLASSNGVSKARNLELVRKWDRRLRLLVRNVNYYENKEKPFLVFVNPNSGSGKAGDIFLKHTANIWNKAHVSFEAVTTEYKNHAREMIISKDLSKYRGVIVVSGDGLIHEVINGLLMRPDWRKSIQLPIGQIPAGSANGLASTAAYISGEQFQANRLELFASRMAFFFTKFKPNPIDLVSIQLFDGSFLNSFMNVEWAIVADVDSESEQFRFLGGLRFLVQFLIRIINLRVYRGRISFLPAESGIGAIKLKNKNITIQTNTNNYSEEENKSRLVNTDLGLTYRHLKSIDQPVPNDWLTIEDNFILFILVNLPLVGMDFLISPDKKIDDDHLVMIFVREGITKFEMLKFIAQCSQGTMLKNPYVETIKVKAFRLEPLDPKYGSLMVDGEPVCYGPIQGEVLPRAANIFANPTQADV